jgi:hypothetical protein
MLFKVTCPSCGRSEQTSDRVLGKEIRCPCGVTMAGVLYSVALEVLAGILRGSPAGGSNANLLPTEEVQKLHELATALDEKHFSLVDAQLPGLQSDPALT